MRVQSEPAGLEGYPKLLTLEDGTTVHMRPLEQTDQPALLAFFRGIPAAERYWLREDVSDAAVIRRWLADLDYNRVLPLIAMHDSVIVADATLHRRGHGARYFLGEIRLVVAPAYRGRGLGYALAAELTGIAQAAGLDRLQAEIVSGVQTAALEAIEQLGFDQAAILPNQLRGPDGARHDLILLSYPLAEEEESAI